MVGTRSRRIVGDRSAGEALRAARRRLKLSLDEAGVALRIPPRQLKSLEEGDLSVFAAEVYARGAYVKYARYLGVKSDHTHRAFLRALSEARELVPLTVPRAASWLARVWGPAGVIVLSLLAGMALVASYLAWQVQAFVRVPPLMLTEPQEVVLSQPSVTVRGVTEPDVLLSINGEAVLLGPDGAFTHFLPLRRGVNVLRVEAMGASGRTNVVEQRLLVPRT